jgi:hypothetical protein
MRFWWREVAGWALVAIGLYIFWQAYFMFMGRTNPEPDQSRYMMIEASGWSFVGIVVFRGGIHLLKVAVAARVCMQAAQGIAGDRPATVRPTRTPVRTLPGSGR